MFNKYVEQKIYFDEDTSVGLSQYGHLIIEQTRDDESNSVVIYEEWLSAIKNRLEKSLKNLDNNGSKIFAKKECGIDTKIYVSSIQGENLHCEYNEIIISQNDSNNVVFEDSKLLEILNEVKINFKKNEGV